uniref:E3 ubiquitin-protein ligase MARCHF8-like n=1 Tax=Erigeron canadensis TaxID=72917 RepID=UPI001CB91E08|nr:E3 ubiquitin-protein ligase MARCHF8-like [Erigeron canadensis]
MEEVKLFVEYDDDYMLYASISSSSEIICCRICHEAEFESARNLEAPCSCSGTVKFAHRDCIQRWCEEKGNTTCEICLQNFEPGYSSPIKLIHQVSLEVPERELNNAAIIEQEENLLETEYDQECSSAADTSASVCRFLCLTLTIFLLARHSCAVLIGGTGDYPFSLLTLLLLRATGILLPMYIIMRSVNAIYNSITRRHQRMTEASSIESM